jgi:hypothetical protein
MESAVKILKANDDFSGVLNLKNVIPYLYRLNPAKTVKLLTDSQYKFYVYLYEDIRDPALMNVLVSHLIKDGNIDSKVFTILVSYHNPEINKQMIEIIQHIDCKKIYKSLKEKIEKELNIILPCEQN